MNMAWKRVLLGTAAVGFTGMVVGEMHAAHAATPSTGTSQPQISPSTQALQKQAVQLQREISVMKQRLKQSESADRLTVSTLTALQNKAVTLQKQLAARKQAIALQQQRVTQTSTPPAVQSVTRASGHGDDGGDHHDGSHDD
ncbi:hypothetical protein [Alicyclobacillus sp. ALC3]|uniref:hypothetical protein n=1 Tax=Alicyclobacillus sp. ALC3 TaxID=2796143 RepID=UPI002377E114|nr:hypothetical protein [Alicyclobacillus sp. ALC3]WDL97246.1 hypothetical protein JC200_00320 [Alicyclobacillus sp. ALC3]